MLVRLVKNKIRNTLEQRQIDKAEDTRPPAALIFGAGSIPGIGAAVAARVAAEGLPVYLAGRSADKIEASAQSIRDAGGDAHTVVVDAKDSSQITAAFEQLERDGYRPDLVVHNVGSNRMESFLDIKPQQWESSWRADCLSGFHVGQQAVQRMRAGKRGTIIFTGASGSLRGKARFARFAMAKAGLRALAQSMAREFGPAGIHVAHVIIDGAVNGNRLREVMPGISEKLGADGMLDPDAIAEAYWAVYQQQRSAWTHEIDLRPFNENW